MGVVLNDLSKLSQAQMLQMLIDAQNKIKDLETRPARRVVFKVTEKGGVSAYGIGRFPVTLYKSQWEQLISAGEELQTFLKANASKLTTKD